MLIKYRFSINSHYVNPIWKDDVQKEYELESQQRFYRAQLSGKINFIRDDFDWLDGQAFDTEFVFLVEKSNDEGQTWTDYWTGKFFKTDCKWDEDDKKVEIKLDTKDDYNDILAGLEKEYNLIKLAPEKTPLQIQKRPLIQLYIPGDSVVSCFLSGNSWEQDTAFEEEDTNELINTYYFALASTLYKIFVSGTGTPEGCLGDYTSENTDTYIGKNVYDIAGEDIYNIYYTALNKATMSTAGTHGKTSADLGSIWRDDNSNDWQLVAIPSTGSLTFIQYFHSNNLPDTASDSMVHVRGATNTSTFFYNTVGAYTASHLYALRRTSDSAIMFASKADYETVPDTVDIDFVADQGTGTLTGFISSIEVYMRYLLDVETIAGLDTYEIPTDDLVDYNRNYTRAIGYAIDQVTISPNANVEATEYGLRDDGYYFVEPPGFPTYYKYYPVARSTWGLSSIWFNFDFFDWSLEEQGRKAYTAKDTSLISDVIKVLLAEFAPDISHDGTDEYSEFLYGDVNPITYNAFRVMITQKSNITAGEYDRPAQKAPITLGSIFTMLRDTFQCYWYIEDSKLKIEHISWFKNGGTYSPSPVYAADLTTLTQRKNNKKWGFESSKYEYDKADLAERMQFKWMDGVTFGFEGFPIEINSKFVEEGKIDEINIGDFTTDVDYMLLNPLAINQDGFALFASILDDTNLFDESDPDFTPDYYINKNDGTLISNPTYNASGFIEVKEETDYAWNYKSTLAWYDENKVYISGSGNTGDDLVYTLESPVGAAYVRVSISDAALPTYKIVEGTTIDGLYKLPFLQRTVEDADLRLQNGLMSWIYLHPNYWVYDLPATDVDINGEAYYVQGIKRSKKQQVKYPSLEDPDPMQLIKTYIGDGQIQKLSVNLSSRMNEIQLKYDTE